MVIDHKRHNMKSLLVIALMISGSVFADSNSTLNECVKKAVQVQSNGNGKEYISSINEGIRSCREEVQAMVASEREAKREATKAKRVARLQAQLAKLQK